MDVGGWRLRAPKRASWLKWDTHKNRNTATVDGDDKEHEMSERRRGGRRSDREEKKLNWCFLLHLMQNGIVRLILRGVAVGCFPFVDWLRLIAEMFGIDTTLKCFVKRDRERERKRNFDADGWYFSDVDDRGTKPRQAKYNSHVQHFYAKICSFVCY